MLTPHIHLFLHIFTGDANDNRTCSSQTTLNADRPGIIHYPGSLGQNPVFDRTWTLVNLLLMGFLAMLYAFNFWVARMWEFCLYGNSFDFCIVG
jgi:hypothetical protein